MFFRGPPSLATTPSPPPFTHLGVDARDDEAGLDAGVHVGLREGAAVHRGRPDAAVERALRRGVAARGPAVDVARVVEHGVLLLKAVQRGLDKRREGRWGLRGGSARTAPPRRNRHTLSLLSLPYLGHDVRSQQFAQPRARVGRVRRRVRVEDFAHNEDIVPAAHRVGVDGHGAQDAVRVVALGLAGGRAVERPVGKVGGLVVGDRLLQDLGR